MAVIKRIYHHYELWEDYKNGMYDYVKSDNDDILIQQSISLLSDKKLFYETSILVIENWNKSTEQNLSNNSQNRQAWIGQASCCYKYKVPEILTRIAWSKMTEIKRNEANLVADKIIKIYEAKNKRVCEILGNQLLFEWNT